MSNTNRARYESALARAHRALWHAHEAAVSLGWEDGEGRALWDMLAPLQELLEASLAGRRRKLRPAAGQLSLTEQLSAIASADAASRSVAGE